MRSILLTRAERLRYNNTPESTQATPTWIQRIQNGDNLKNVFKENTMTKEFNS
jgi:hypothetical protein